MFFNLKTDSIRTPYLIQVLNKPSNSPLVNSFSFGGGLKNGGFSDEAMDLFSPLFSFEYMGAAEFEFGDVPEAFEKLAKKHKKLKVHKVPVAAERKERPCPPGPVKEGTEKKFEGDVFLLATDEEAEVLTPFIQKQAKVSVSPDCKEMVRLHQALCPMDERDSDHIAWLDINNGTFFTLDNDLMGKMCEKYGVKYKQ